MTSRTFNRRVRANTNVLAMFDQALIREFKEAFNFLDQNRDSLIDHDDLREIFSSFGKDVSDEFIDEMLCGVPGEKLNFTMFLTMFGERLQGMDPVDVIQASFSCFDDENTGTFESLTQHLLAFFSSTIHSEI